MKKIALLLTIVFALTTLFSTMSFAISALPIRVVVNGDKISFPDSQPFTDSNGRVQVPVRFVSEALGANVGWDSKSKKVTVTLKAKKVVLVVGKKNYEVDGQSKLMDTAALLKEKRTFVPIRFVSEALGATVEWKASTKTVYIDTNKTPANNTGTKEVSGFIVPKDTPLTVVAIEKDLNFETHLSINFLRANVEKQKDDLEKTLLQKFSESTVKQIMDHVRKKTKSSDVLEKKVIVDPKTSQVIGISKSVSDSIDIWIYIKGIQP